MPGDHAFGFTLLDAAEHVLEDRVARRLGALGLLEWGELDPEDALANDEAHETGGRLFSAYKLKEGTKIWIITEDDRSSTCILLPDEY
ncbi:MAG TPA: hypothetical protein VMM92_00470 [Thermoanaerobaculia bacterium]|nr:hypothetical protein [Thermoanaerobaculia bacterium]